MRIRTYLKPFLEEAGDKTRLERLFTNNHFDSFQPESSTAKLTKPTPLETQATINIIYVKIHYTAHFDCKIQTTVLAVATCRTDVCRGVLVA